LSKSGDGESQLDVHRILLSRVETDLTPEIFFENEKSCDDLGFENRMEVHFYKWYGPEVLPSGGIPDGFSSDDIKTHVTFTGEKVEPSAN
jgi:hypothetical protein